MSQQKSTHGTIEVSELKECADSALASQNSKNNPNKNRNKLGFESPENTPHRKLKSGGAVSNT
jgi:hypothetical protein